MPAVGRLEARALPKDSNWALTEAETGFQPLELLRTSEFDLALVDISLPGMNGLDRSRRLRGSASARYRSSSFDVPRPPLTSNSMPPQLTRMSRSPPASSISSLPKLSELAALRRLETRPSAIMAATRPSAPAAASPIELPAPLAMALLPGESRAALYAPQVDANLGSDRGFARIEHHLRRDGAAGEAEVERRRSSGSNRADAARH